MTKASNITEPQPVQIGPRTRNEIERRIRELAGRFHPSGRDLHELSRLRALLRWRRRS
jgi:hypothetical protein